MSQVTLTPAELSNVRSLVADLSLARAARKLGVGREVVTRLLAGLDVRAGSVAIIRTSLLVLGSDFRPAPQKVLWMYRQGAAAAREAYAAALGGAHDRALELLQTADGYFASAMIHDGTEGEA